MGGNSTNIICYVQVIANVQYRKTAQIRITRKLELLATSPPNWIAKDCILTSRSFSPGLLESLLLFFTRISIMAFCVTFKTYHITSRALGARVAALSTIPAVGV